MTDIIILHELNATDQNNITWNNHGPIILHVSDVINIIFVVAILIIGVVGNSMIVYFIGWKKRRRIQRFEGFLLMLGVIDLMASIFIPLSFLYLTATNFERWDFGIVGCKMIPPLLQVSITLSQGMLIIISYERYHTLVKPFNERIKKTTIACWLLIVLVVAVLIIIPYMSAFKIYRTTETIQFCQPYDPTGHLFMTSSTLHLTRDIIAIVIMGLLNNRMSHALTKQHDELTWKREKMSQKGRRLLRRVFVIFITLTVPVDLYQVVYYALYMGNVPFTDEVVVATRIANTFLNIVQASNSVVNVFIYSRMHYIFHLECCVPAWRREHSMHETVHLTSARKISTTRKYSTANRKCSATRKNSTVRKCSTVKMTK